MMPSCRIQLFAAVGFFLLLSLSPDQAFSEEQDKERAQEKSQEKSQAQPQSSSETEPAPPKLLTEPKSSQGTPAGKADATPKASSEPKPQSQTLPPLKLSTEPKPQTAPPAKQELPPERETKEKEKEKDKEKDKEKEVHKRPLGSLILTVKLALLADARLFRYEIEVGENDQTVTLEGRVSSEEEKSGATEVAKSVSGVKAVVNKLDLDKGLAQTLIKKQDEIITGLVKERFAKSATLKAANFDVKTEEGVVSISGAVRFQVIALEAAEAARQVPGVKAVKTDKVRLEGES